jgi:hypothetical protein
MSLRTLCLGTIHGAVTCSLRGGYDVIPLTGNGPGHPIVPSLAEPHPLLPLAVISLGAGKVGIAGCTSVIQKALPDGSSQNRYPSPW